MTSPRRSRITDRSRQRDRHGRGLRSSAAGPHLPFLRTRVDTFDEIVASTADYLRELWPDDLAEVTFEVAGLPARPSADRVERWTIDATRRSIILYRLPIERLARPHESRGARDDEWLHWSLVEGYVFRAVGDLLGRDPWDLAPERWRDV